MLKKSNKINKILEAKNIKECSGKDKNKLCQNNINKKGKNMYEDMYDQNSGIIELKYKDFMINKKTNNIQCIHPLFKDMNRGIIIFYAPWCQHCNNMYDDLIELSINYMNIFPIAVVNVEDLKNKNDELSSKANVTRYPTMKVLNKELYLEDYNNDLTKDNIIYYINMNLY